MPNKRITQLNQLDVIANEDLFAVVDLDGQETKKVTFDGLKQNLPGTATGSAQNTYIVPVDITVQDSQELWLTGSTYENTSMIHLSWTGPTGNMDIFLPDATSETNTYRSIRLISDSTFSTSTIADLFPSASQTLDNSSGAYRINKAYEGIMVWSDGTEWFRIQSKAG